MSTSMDTKRCSISTLLYFKAHGILKKGMKGSNIDKLWHFHCGCTETCKGVFMQFHVFQTGRFFIIHRHDIEYIWATVSHMEEFYNKENEKALAQKVAVIIKYNVNSMKQHVSVWHTVGGFWTLLTWLLLAPALKHLARRTWLRRRAVARCQTCPAASWGVSPAPPSDGPGPESFHGTTARSNVSGAEERETEGQRGTWGQGMEMKWKERGQ